MCIVIATVVPMLIHLWPISSSFLSQFSPIHKISFFSSFYTDEDVRNRSVCEITSSVAIDALGTPLPNGVNDPRLGPQDSAASGNAPCLTCCQRHQFCPGHFGHIELCVPVYHPLLFGKIVEFLRIKCLNCHRLKAARRQLMIFQTKFLLLQQGEYSQAVDLDRKLETCRFTSSQEGGGGGGGDYGDDDGGSRRNKTMVEAAARQAVDQVLKETQTSLKRSAASSSSSSEYKKRSTPPTTFEEAYMRDLVKSFISTCKGAKSCPHCSAYSPKIRQDSSNKIFQSPLSATAKRLNAAEGIELRPALTKIPKRSKSDDNSNDDGNDDMVGYDSDDNQDMNIDVEGSDNDNNEDSDKEDDEVEEAVIKSGKDKYMSAAEVQAQIRRTWEIDPDICNAIFAVQGCEIFFMQAIPVPPNRFRPTMHLGGMVVQNTQNDFLNKIVQSNEIVRSNFASNEQAAGYKAWIELQTQINCFMDSSKDPSANMDPPMGIRQLLERKEGIFRKHMMGKRVNFACRSVISPDPYIGTNEIGLPRHFAETLTYPTPVTDINISEMRELVERGPFQYPGARWVEINYKRMDLTKQDDHQRQAIAAQLLMHARRGNPAIVGRQLRDGDMVLMNRQVRHDHQRNAWRYCPLLSIQGGGNLSCTTLKNSLLDYDHFHRWMSSRNVAYAAVPRIDFGHFLRFAFLFCSVSCSHCFIWFLNQPTLHKPGIMAHQVRVLHSPTQKTIRMHYASKFCRLFMACGQGQDARSQSNTLFSP